ncbi:MAG TPA: TIGR04076 family protein [bacterium (Candidatus Stahlbacteria)]|nr:TIGR04076 family protein [Candidatus Stahlbacteria bacterium]
MHGDRVIITVAEQKGTCEAGHRTGQKFIYEGRLPDICPAAFHSLYPYLRVLQFGGNLPWEEEGQALIACPDPENPVVFRLERK